jgi:hypothetical protein
MHSDWRKHLPAMLVFATYAGFGACGDAWAADRTGTSHNLTDQLGALEERSYAAWKSGDTTFWKSFLADQFVAWGSAGRLDERSAVPVLGRGGCQIDSYRLTDIQATGDAWMWSGGINVLAELTGRRRPPVSGRLPRCNRRRSTPTRHWSERSLLHFRAAT